MKHVKLWSGAAVGLSLMMVLAGCGSGASQASTSKNSSESPTDFYKDKTLTIVVPYDPGGGYDQWARIIIPFMEKYLGVSKVEVKNVPGGGGLVGTDQLYSGQPDGLTIGDTNAGGDVFDQITNVSGVKFDVSKINWIGRPDDDPGMIVARAGSPYHSFADLLKIKDGKQTLRMVSDGVGDAHYFGALIAANAFQIPFHMIAAYKGSQELKAGFIRGDGDVVEISASDLMPIVQAEKATVIAMQSQTRWPQMPNMPTLAELLQQQGASQDKVDMLKSVAGVFNMGHAFMAPEGVPQDRLEFLREAFQKSIEDPEFIAQAKKANRYVGYASPQQLQDMATSAMAQAAQFHPLLQTH